jgi:hypothetical protein
MNNFNLKKYLKEGKLATNEVYSEKQRKWACAQDGPQFDEMCKDTAISKKKKLKEFTDYGQEGIYPKKEKPGDMFQQKEVEDMFPNGMASRSNKAFQDRLKKHGDWTEQSGYNNTFVHMQYHETKDLEDEYFIYQTQHYNTNYDDFRSPKFTTLSITKNKDTDKEEDLGSYIVDTDAYIRDLNKFREQGNLGKRVSEGKKKLEENRAQDLASDYSLKELNDFLQRLYGEMEQEAEPEGGPIADQYADEIYQYEEAIRIKKKVGQRGRKDLTYDQAIGREDITDETGTYTIRPDGTKDYKRITPMTRDEFEKSSKFDRKNLNEFIGGELEKRNDALYGKLVPGMGKADTQEGEMLRAINRIIYRYYNDGDEYFRGYGTETAGPAHSFLVNANTGVRSAMEKIFGDGTNYEETIQDALEHILSHIEAKQGKYTPNAEDMFSYEAEFEDEEDYEDDYYDEEEEYYEK